MQIRIWRNVRVNRLFISKNKSSGFLYVNYFLHLPLSSPTDSISYVLLILKKTKNYFDILVSDFQVNELSRNKLFLRLPIAENKFFQKY
jgi:hypothetical protein